MRKFNSLFTVLVLILAPPTVLILASWDALPGNPMYQVKKALENTTLLALSPTPLAPKFSVKFAERRFSEANKLLATQSSTVGYELLVEQAKKSKEIIVEKQDVQTAQKFLTKLEEYQKEIDQKQETFTGIITAQPVPPVAPEPSPPPHRTEPPAPRPGPPLDEEVVCIQVITPARNTKTGECREFPTPCDVPKGWLKAGSCADQKGPPSEPKFPTEKTKETKPPTPKITKIEHERPEEIAAKLKETKEDLEKIKEEIEREVPKVDRDRESERRDGKNKD